MAREQQSRHPIGTTSTEALHSELIPSVHVGLDAEGDAAWEVYAPTLHQCSQATVFAAVAAGALWKQDSSQRWCTSQPLGGPQAKANLALLKDRQQAQAVIRWYLRRRPAASGSGVQPTDVKKKSTAFSLRRKGCLRSARVHANTDRVEACQKTNVTIIVAL